MSAVSWLRWFTTLVVVFALPGCGDDDGPVPVTGTVLLDGHPVVGATVSFLPETDGRPAGGVTDADGRFQLTTIEAGDGALPGNYRVVVTKVEPVELPPFEEDAGEDDERLTERFEEYLQSRRANRRSLLPTVYGRAESTPLSCEVTRELPPVVLRLNRTPDHPRSSP